MFRILQVGSAFIGIIVGAGFASGQEILQYFTSFGHLGTIGGIVSGLLFGFLGMSLVWVGRRLKTVSHKKAIYEISGPYLGPIVDYIIIFTLFGVGVVMVAGAGSTVEQQFGLPSFVGSALMMALVVIVVTLNVKRVVAIIGSITPFLILALIVIGIYSFFTMDQSLAELEPVAKAQPTSLPNWFISSVNYVSFNIALGASMSLVMGGAEKTERTAALGGLIGGFGIGVLIIISHLSIFSKIEHVAGYAMPILKVVDLIGPGFGIIMSIILLGMIFNTAVGMFYAFTARFVEMNTRKSNIFIVITGIAGYIASFIGFTDLVAFFYPFIGYLGLFLVGALIYAPIKLRRIA